MPTTRTRSMATVLFSMLLAGAAGCGGGDGTGKPADAAGGGGNDGPGAVDGATIPDAAPQDALSSTFDGAADRTLDAGTADTGVAMDSGSADLPPAMVPPNVPLTQFASVFAQVTCEKLFTCCTAAERMALEITDPRTCVNQAGFLLSIITLVVSDSISQNRADYDGVAASMCARQYQAQTCAEARTGGAFDLDRMMTSCDSVIKPKVALGGACRQSLECIAGYCAGGGDGRTGMCAALKANGADCEDDDECMSETCDGATMKCAQPSPTANELCTP